jgi:tetratricopeptide (TPR) repeat protein
MVQLFRLRLTHNSGLVNVLLLLAGLALISACGPNIRKPPPQAPVDDLGGHNVNPDATSPRRKVPSARMVRGRQSAVRTLRHRAIQQKKLKKYSSAAVLLERALQIDPYNAGIWNNLAEVRYAQGRYGLAESLALRSISYAKGNRRLKAKNWRLIAKTRSLRGDAVGANEAASKANNP